MKCSMCHEIPKPDPHPGEYPVGICPGEDCTYREPHRHGSNCDKSCACKGVGAETAPLTDEDVQSCDWGGCDRDAVATRLCRCSSKYHVVGVTAVLARDVWLSVCSWHAGWDDYETEGGTR